VKLGEYSALDISKVHAVLEVLMLTHPDFAHILEIASTRPGISIRPLAGGAWEAFLLDQDDEPVVLGAFTLTALLTGPPGEAGSVN
jgi:hypothetical protein